MGMGTLDSLARHLWLFLSEITEMPLHWNHACERASSMSFQKFWTGYDSYSRPVKLISVRSTPNQLNNPIFVENVENHFGVDFLFRIAFKIGIWNDTGLIDYSRDETGWKWKVTIL